MTRIYLDHAATSPLLPEARAAMEPWLDSGNASTLYAEGRKAKLAIDESREILASTLGCEFAEVLFNSGGTEGAAMAIVGCALAAKDGSRRRVLISAAEHHCVLNTQAMLEALGFTVETLPVDRSARLDLAGLSERLDDSVLLVCAMHGNNELGSISDVPAAAEAAHLHGALLFCDAVQSFGRSPWTVDDLGADLVSLSAHKIGGPKGAGALYAKAGTKLKPLIAGGGQERELRAGTENVAAIAGFGAAVRAHAPSPEMGRNRDLLEQRLVSIGAVVTVDPGVCRLPGHCHVRFPGVSAETLLIVLDRLGVSAGSGAACSSGSIEPSHVLIACGCSTSEAKEGLRFTLGPSTTHEDVEEAARRIEAGLEQVRRVR